MENDIMFSFRMDALHPDQSRELAIIGAVIIQLNQMTPKSQKRVVNFLFDSFGDPARYASE